MKHLLNNMSEQEKNSIRKQHTGGMNVMVENFSKLINSKLGDVKPMLSEQTPFGFKKSEDYMHSSDGEDVYDDTDFRSSNFNLKKYSEKSKKSQIKDIIDNFDLIGDCEDVSYFNELDLLRNGRHERDLIYCLHYKGKSKDDMIQIYQEL
jgi:hypothetical protein